MTDIKLVHVDTLSCEAIFRIAPNGDYIIVVQCGDVTEPAVKNRVYIFRSKDEGKNWSKAVAVCPENGKAVYATEVWVHDGLVDVFLTAHTGKFLSSETFVMRSEDSGQTFYRVADVPQWEGLIFIRGVLPLQDGTYLFPFQRYSMSKQENDILERECRYFMDGSVEFAEVGMYIGRDVFSAWKEGKSIRLPIEWNGCKVWKWPEPTLAKLSDGRIKMLLRVDSAGYLYECVSRDGGLSWSEPVKSNLKNPGNKPKLVQFPDGRIGLINTFNSTRGFCGRKPLSVWISDDDMKTWKYKRKVVDFDGWLSYPDGIVTQDGRHILFAFDFNRHDTYFVDHTVETCVRG